MLFLAFGLFGCAPAGVPAGIPPDASVHWSLKGNFSWTWARNLRHGCAAWMAKDSWADVQLLVDVQCGSGREEKYLPGRGLSYFSSSDHLTFSGYWPWSQDGYSKLMVFDEAGMVSHILPCPHSLSADQIDRMRIVAREALASAQTDGERRILTRVQQRLAVLDGAKLASSQAGCTDYDASLERVDVWRGR